MEDRDSGAPAPHSGATMERERFGAPSALPAGGETRQREARGPAQTETPKKRRRRRKRGRKVFSPEARPGAQPPAGTTAKPALPPPPAVPVKPVAPPPPPAVELAPPFRRPWVAGAGDPPVYGALDLGTNNCRLLLAIPGRPGQFRVVDAFSRIVRLGEGLGATGRLGQAAMDRAVEALKVCAEKLAARPVRRARLIATEACRSAANGTEFLDRVRGEAGLDLEIVDRQTEARLAVSGCGSLIERDTQGVVLFDIGGGSSEIALIDLSGRRSGRLSNHIVAWTSLPVGVVSLAERFGGKDVTPETFEAMVADVEAMLSHFEGKARLAHVASGVRFHLLGTSGTVTTLAGVFLELERYDRRRVDGLWMSSDQVDRMTQKLLGWDFAARVANPCIGADRADLVLAGCAILEAIRRVWPAGRLRVADRGLREGILTELMAQDGAWRWSRQGRHRHP